MFQMTLPEKIHFMKTDDQECKESESEGFSTNQQCNMDSLSKSSILDVPEKTHLIFHQKKKNLHQNDINFSFLITNVTKLNSEIFNLIRSIIPSINSL